jgi:hypothetical protein
MEIVNKIICHWKLFLKENEESKNLKLGMRLFKYQRVNLTVIGISTQKTTSFQKKIAHLVLKMH